MFYTHTQHANIAHHPTTQRLYYTTSW